MSTYNFMSLFMAFIMMLSGIFVKTEDDFYEDDDYHYEENEIISENDFEGFDIPEDVSGDGDTFDIFLGYSIFDADYVVEEETGDTIKDIIYNRNKEVEEQFDINFYFRSSGQTSSEASPIIRSLIQSGDDTYEVFMNVQNRGIPLVYENLFVNWAEDMPYANLENPWWNASLNDNLNYADKYYAVSGAYNLHNYKAMGCLAFNKTMMDELGLIYPYDMVRDGKWTIDEFTGMVKAAGKDLNGDGLMKPEDDRYGFTGWKWEMMPALFTGMGGKAVVKDANGLPKLNVNNETNYNVIDKMIELFDSECAWDGGNTYGVANTMFKESRLLFMDTTLAALPGLRDFEEDFGTVPYPKLDENQEEYHSRVVSFSSLTYVPITNSELELTSAVLEYMAYLSHRDLVPAFYDEILTFRGTRDSETEEMIDIIRDGATFVDESYLTGGDIINIVTSGQNTLSSRYAASGDMWELKLNNIIDFWEK